MAATNSSLAVLIAQAGGVAAGGATIVSQGTSGFFATHPILGFLAMGVMGALCGCGLMVERRLWDDKTLAQKWTSVAMRVVIGCTASVAIGVWWADSSAGARGMWMAFTFIATSAPLEMSKAAVELLTAFLSHRTGSDRHTR